MLSLSAVLSRKRILWAFYLFLLFVGLRVACIQPPFMLPDEGAHYLRAYEVSRFKFINSKAESGVSIPCAEYGVVAQKYLVIAFQQEIPSRSEGGCSVKSINTAGTYSFVPYIPAAVALRIAEAFDTTVEAKLIAARAASFLVYFSLICYGVGGLVAGRRFLLCFAMMPAFFWQMTALSADGAAIAWSWLYIILVTHYVQNELLVTKQALFIASLLGAMIGLSKGLYAPVCLISLALWRYCPGASASRRLSILFLPTALALLSFLALTGVANPELVYLGNGAQPSAQLYFVAENPIEYLKACVLALAKLDILGMTAPQYVVPDSVVLGPQISRLFILVGVVSVFTTDFRCGPWIRGIFFLIAIIQTLAICLPLYLTYTPVGYGQVLGFQGRYLFPIAPLLMVALSSDIRKISWVRENWLSIFVVGLPAVLLIVAGSSR
jgi:uncharacterized membrane protein